MTIKTETLMDGSIVVNLQDMDDWEEFAADNHDALCEQYGSTAKAHQHCVQGGLIIGGGSAPSVAVYFVE